MTTHGIVHYLPPLGGHRIAAFAGGQVGPSGTVFAATINDVRVTIPMHRVLLIEWGVPTSASGGPEAA